MPRVRRWRTALALTATAALLSGCGFTGGDPGADSLQVAIGIPPRSGWSPASDDALILHRLGVTETLTDVGADGAIRPELAESWSQVSPLEWRFTLADGVRFHSGEPVTAQAAADSINRVLADPAPPRALRGAVDRAEAVDQRTLLVRSTTPDPILPLRLSTANAAVLAPAAVLGDGRVDPAKGIGTGPFRVEAADGAQSVRLVRDDGYRGAAAQLPAADVRFVEDPAARVNGLRSGEFDLIDKVPAGKLAEISGQDGLRVSTVDVPRTTALHLNTARGPFADPQVRRAAALAVDRAGIVDGVLHGHAVPAERYFGPTVPYGSKNPPPAADPDAAERLLAARPADITLGTYPDRPDLPAVAAVVADELTRAGFSVRIVQQPADQLEPRILSGELDAVVYSRSHLVDVPDAGGYLTSDFSCRGGFNLDHYCDPRLDALIGSLGSTGDSARRAEIFRQADDLLAAQTVGVPLFHEQQHMGHRDGVRGVPADPLERELLTEEVSLG
ncbi:ABC transporter substrate-binding protein [Saccharopolyspora hirsuta]|uniref:ABC transporter substrate-binding protein n=1 Tax=Saccharopolyspora hirsuta TaxID=1837 RepID=A0A5M7BQN7_SACHI|nr:ABC transporter substrate-binding protein [Saccharopolyspora hirsuta]KAA5830507.1 ABC transporter substrate-binding protein [Saccharopolyspora hirsuta]